MKHMKGPWTYEIDPTELRCMAVRGRYEYEPGEWASVWVAREVDPQNVDLIAAAPDMLDMLKTIENDEKQVPAWLWTRIQDVIAKAEGRA